MSKEIFKCPECGHQDWQESYFYCEDCGSHVAVECKGCGEVWDHVWGDEVYDKVLESYGVYDSADIPKKKGIV